MSFEKNGVEGVQNILPFIPKETMGTIAKAAYKNHSIEGIDTILTFVPKEILEQGAKGQYSFGTDLLTPCKSSTL